MLMINFVKVYFLLIIKYIILNHSCAIYWPTYNGYIIVDIDIGKSKKNKFIKIYKF